MIESSRRKILDTLNSRYIYKRVVCFLMYIHIYYHSCHCGGRLNIYGGFVQNRHNSGIKYDRATR